MNKINLKTILLMVLIAIVCIGCDINESQEFSAENAWSHIEELTAKKYSGRLMGTEGNAEAAEYIADQFESIGLIAYNDEGNYYQEFDGISPLLRDPVNFEINDLNGNIIRQFDLREEFNIITKDFSAGGTVKGKISLVQSMDQFEGNEKILLLPNDEVFNEENYFKFMESGVKAVIRSNHKELRGREQNLLLKSVFLGDREKYKDSNKLINIVVTDRVMEELVNFSTQEIEVSIDVNLEFSEVRGCNIVGYIEGNDPDLKEEVLLISAHYDHVGIDPDGVYYPGALDNTSGVAMMLELAYELKDTKPRRTIVFVAFDGEESGLQGSKYFAYHANKKIFPIEKTMVINLDMVGSKEEVNLSLDTNYGFDGSTVGQTTNRVFAETVKGLAVKNGIQYEIHGNAGDSDHYSFIKRGVPAITFTNYSTALIHTPEDTIVNLDQERFSEVGEFIIKTINYFGVEAEDLKYSEFTNQQRNLIKFSLIALGIILLSFTILMLISMRLNDGKKEIGRFPKLTIIVFFLVLVVMTSLYSWNNHERLPASISPKPWNKAVVLPISATSTIEAVEINKDHILILSKDDTFKKNEIDLTGELIDTEVLCFSENAKKVISSNNQIYYQSEGELYKKNWYSGREGLIAENIDSFVATLNGSNEVVVGINEDSIKILVNEESFSSNEKNIIQAAVQNDDNGNTHIVYTQKLDDRYVIKYMMLDKDMNVRGPITLSGIDKKVEFKFGIDQASGLVIYQRNDDLQYCVFPLGTTREKSACINSYRLHTPDGAVVRIKYVDVENFSKINKDNIHVLVTGNAETSESYSYILTFFHGKVDSKELIYSSDDGELGYSYLLNDGQDQYVIVKEFADPEQYKLLSSDPFYRYSNLQTNLIMLLSQFLQSLFQSLFVFITKLHWLLPGAFFVGAYHLIYSKDVNILVCVLAVATNFVTQVLTFNMPSLFGIRNEAMIVSLVISLISMCLVLCYRVEKRRVGFKSLVLLFMITNLILFSFLYAPKIFEDGSSHLNDTGMFSKDNQIEERYE